MFIELTTSYGKFIGNVNLLQRVFVTEKEGKTAVVGWNNNGYMEVMETYEEVIKKLNSANVKVDRS